MSRWLSMARQAATKQRLGPSGFGDDIVAGLPNLALDAIQIYGVVFDDYDAIHRLNLRERDHDSRHASAK